jgi:hypothetical protein
MGANAQLAVPAFVAGEILTAAEMTQVNTGIPVFATTVTRDAAFGGSGEKVLAQGQYAYIEATSTLQVYTGSAWISAISSGLNLISSTTIGSAVSSVTVSNCFSATYANYLVKVDTVFSVNGARILMRGTSSTGATYAGNFLSMDTGGSTVTGYQYVSSTYHEVGLSSSVGRTCTDVSVFNIFDAAVATRVTHQYAGHQYFGSGGSRDSATISSASIDIAPASGTMTGGTIRVYGYANS